MDAAAQIAGAADLPEPIADQILADTFEVGIPRLERRRRDKQLRPNVWTLAKRFGMRLIPYVRDSYDYDWALAIIGYWRPAEACSALLKRAEHPLAMRSSVEAIGTIGSRHPTAALTVLRRLAALDYRDQYGLGLALRSLQPVRETVELLAALAPAESTELNVIYASTLGHVGQLFPGDGAPCIVAALREAFESHEQPPREPWWDPEISVACAVLRLIQASHWENDLRPHIAGLLAEVLRWARSQAGQHMLAIFPPLPIPSPGGDLRDMTLTREVCQLTGSIRSQEEISNWLGAYGNVAPLEWRRWLYQALRDLMTHRMSADNWKPLDFAALRESEHGQLAATGHHDSLFGPIQDINVTDGRTVSPEEIKRLLSSSYEGDQWDGLGAANWLARNRPWSALDLLVASAVDADNDVSAATWPLHDALRVLANSTDEVRLWSEVLPRFAELAHHSSSRVRSAVAASVWSVARRGKSEMEWTISMLRVFSRDSDSGVCEVSRDVRRGLFLDYGQAVAGGDPDIELFRHLGGAGSDLVRRDWDRYTLFEARVRWCAIRPLKWVEAAANRHTGAYSSVPFILLQFGLAVFWLPAMVPAVATVWALGRLRLRTRLLRWRIRAQAEELGRRFSNGRE